VASKRKNVRVMIVLVTCRSKREAEKIALALLEKRLAACGTVVGSHVKSIYRWKGRIEKAREILLILKTTPARFPKLEKEIRRLHSYEVPEIIAIPVTAGSAAYLKWVSESVTPD
jgi:periplasmic divalent cation tolerance protein